METRFSPGPWHVGCLGGGGKCQCAYILDEGHAGAIATVHVNNGIGSISEGGNDAPIREQAIANMHLIAAAPELFAELEQCVALLEIIKEHWIDYDHIYSISVDAAKTVLGKAALSLPAPDKE